MNDEGTVFALEVDLQRLVGMPCWSIMVSAGAHVLLDFGQKLLRVPILFDQTLTEEQRMYKGEASLFIEHAVWRLEHQGTIIGSWRDSRHPSGTMQSRLGQCHGKVIEHVTLLRPGLDLLVQFTAGLALRIFCDQTNTDHDNFTYFMVGNSYTVGAYSQLRSERVDY